MQSRPIFFSIRSLILAACMVAFYSILISTDLGGINPYADAYKSRIGLYSDKLDSLSRISNWRTKMFLRHLANVEIPEYVVGHIQPGDTVLLPPYDYAKKYMTADPTWMDPRIFTYMVGFHPIVSYKDYLNGHHVNTFIVLEGNSIWLARRGGTTNVDSLINVYSQESKKGNENRGNK